MEETDETKAQEYLEKLGAVFHYDCYHDKKPEGCHQYAEYLTMVKKESVKALQLFQTCCDEMKFPESCLALGNMYLTGKGVEKDLSTALEQFTKACDMGSMGGCNNAGLVYQNGYNNMSPDHVKALKFFQRSCKGDFKNGCFNMSIVYLQGRDDIPKDMKKALRYSLKSCDLGHSWGCANASRILRLGDGIDKDTKKSEELLRKAKKLAQQM